MDAGNPLYILICFGKLVVNRDIWESFSFDRETDYSYSSL